MTARNDYRVTVKVRNNNILRACEAAGILSIPALAREIGVGYSALNDLINMTASPLSKKGETRVVVDKLCDALNVPFDQLFSEQQRFALETNKSEKEVNAEQVFAIVNSTGLSGEIEHDDGLGFAVDSVFQSLTEREVAVLKMRYGFDQNEMKLAEIAEHFGISIERIRQIEAKALRKMRHPNNSGNLRPFLGME